MRITEMWKKNLLAGYTLVDSFLGGVDFNFADPATGQSALHVLFDEVPSSRESWSIRSLASKLNQSNMPADLLAADQKENTVISLMSNLYNTTTHNTAHEAETLFRAWQFQRGGKTRSACLNQQLR